MRNREIGSVSECVLPRKERKNSSVLWFLCRFRLLQHLKVAVLECKPGFVAMQNGLVCIVKWACLQFFGVPKFAHTRCLRPQHAVHKRLNTCTLIFQKKRTDRMFLNSLDILRAQKHANIVLWALLNEEI